jgi:hypothetical protein
MRLSEETEETEESEVHKLYVKKKQYINIAENDPFLSNLFSSSVSSLSSVSSIRGRDLELWLPIFTIGLLKHESVFQQLVKLSEEKVKEKDETIEFTIEEVVIRTCYELVFEPKFYTLKDITEIVNEKLNKTEFGHDLVTSKTVGSTLSRLGFKSRSRGSGGLVTIFLQKDAVEDVAERLGFNLKD